jgi:hypothetical protein
MKRFVLVGVKKGVQEIIQVPKKEIDTFRFLKNEFNRLRVMPDCGGFDEIMLCECSKYSSVDKVAVRIEQPKQEQEIEQEQEQPKQNGSKRNPFGVAR